MHGCGILILIVTCFTYSAAGEVALECCVVDDKCFSEIKVEYLPPDLKSSCVPQQRSEEIHSFKQKGRQRDVDGIEAAQSISKHTQHSATWGGGGCTIRL